ncbi:protein NLRC5-like isoform X2 [Acanthaster planci]|uniref:Protein NLRC5-like isoform X2 n=1 Tax=Acanthaster planci TaxID=133434 RepID=A0A8B7ZN13_ACAPL|nr:protein NLRC5-like isoform X2 [Acanthaster planci]
MADWDGGESQRRLGRHHEATGPLDDDSLYSISTQIHAGEWRGLATRLGFSAAEVSHFPSDHSFTAEQINQMLVTWRNRQPVHVNQTEALCKALKEVGNAQLADNLTGELDDSSLYDIAEQIDANEWTRLAAKLGFNQARVSHFKDNHSSVVDQINGMLVAWRKKQPGDVNQREALCKALREVGDINLADKLSEYSASDVQSLNAANICEDELKSHYKETGSFLQMNPWCEDLKKPIAEMCTKVQLITGEGKTEYTLVSYEEMLLLKTKEGKLIPIAVLSGLAGRGKTTLFDKIAYDWAAGSCKVLQKYKLVFLLKMCNLKQESNLVGSVFDQLLAEDTNLDLNALESYIKMNSGKVLILLDGFDELRTTSLNKSSFGSILKILNRRMCRGCTVLVSTRPSHLVRLTTKALIQQPFTHVRVMGFSKEDITEYVNKFYCDEPTKAKELLTRIRSSNLFSVLAESPMLLLMMCSLWSKDSKLPETMSSFYHNAVDEIGKRKDVSEQEINSVVIELGKVGLQGLLFPDQVLSFKDSDFEPGELNLALKAGILTTQRVFKGRVPHGSVQFIHKTFQEFCSALYLQNLFEVNRQEFQKILNEIVSKSPVDFEYLLRFCCGGNETCTFEILNVFLAKCKNRLSVRDRVGQLALHCYFESQCKCLPSKKFIQAVLRDNINLHGLLDDTLLSVTYFLRRVAEDSGSAYLDKIKKLNISHCEWIRSVTDLAFAVSAMKSLNKAQIIGSLTSETIAPVMKSLRNLAKLVSLNLFYNYLDSTAASWGMHLKEIKPLQWLNLSHCSLNGEDMVHVAESLKDLPNLARLDVPNNNLGGTAASWGIHLKELKPLQELILRNCSLNGQDMVHVVESLKGLHNLATLDIPGNNLGGTAASWGIHVKELKPLQRLDLRNCSLNGQDMVHVVESLKDLPNFAELDVSDNNLDGTTASWGMHLKELKPLQEVDLSHCSLNEQDMVHVVGALKDLPNLARLDVSGNNLGGTAASWGMHLKDLKPLQKMDLRGCSLNGQDMVHVVELLKDLPNFARLDVSDNNLGGSAASWGMHLKELKPLQRMDLSHCSLNEQDMVHVAESLKDLPNLARLDVPYNNLGGTAASWGMNLKDLKPLQRMDLRGCSLNGQDMVHVAEALRDLPNLVSLDVHSNNLGGTAASWGMYLKELKPLQELDLRSCSLNGQDMVHVTKSLKELPNLVSLDVSGNADLAGTATSWCLPLKHAKALRDPELYSCELTEEDKKRLHDALGNLDKLLL